jgi:MinD-like ATPase involved in chromosome partitioning or flagellar assembly
MNMEHDQAQRLRELVREFRTSLPSESCAPIVVAVAGGSSKVGATTVTKLLAAEFSRKSINYKLLQSSEELNGDKSEADIILIDVGAGYTERTSPIWQQADLVLLVTTEKQEAVLATYSTLKRAKSASRSLPIWLVANRCEDACAAESLYQRMANSCMRFLGCSVSGAPWLPIWNAIEESSTAGSSVAGLAQFVFSQTSSLARVSKQAA